MHLGVSLATLRPGHVGGAETYLRALLRELATLERPERITILANPDVREAYGHTATDRLALWPVDSYRPSSSSVRRAAALARAMAAPRRLRRELPQALDVIHFPIPVPVPKAEAPSVVTYHDLAHRDLPRHFSRATRLWRRWAYDGAAREARIVITVSQFSRERMVEHLDLDAERIRVVHHGIDHARFRPDDDSDDDRLVASLGVSRRFLIYPANLWPHKNHERLLRAFAGLRDLDDLQLVLAGQPYGRLDWLRRLIERLGLSGRVRHVGYVAEPVVPALYRRAAAMVFPSLYEGFGAPPLEAMACGCPVAASGRGALSEVCGSAALYFDPEDESAIAAAIRRLVAERGLRDELAKAGVRRAGGFTWRRAALRHVALFDEAAGIEPSAS